MRLLAVRALSLSSLSSYLFSFSFFSLTLPLRLLLVRLFCLVRSLPVNWIFYVI